MPEAATETLSRDDLTSLAEAALAAFDVAPVQGADCATILVLGDMMGIRTHGTARIPAYADRLRSGGINAHAAFSVERLAPGLRRLDGDDGLGPAIGGRALAEAMEAARETGIASVHCARSNHFGAIAPYAYLAAQEGFASIVCSNATTTIAPAGGRAARLGNNPLGFGVPNPGGDPVLLDMALSVVARAKIRTAAEAGETIPESWATDAGGRPTSDPAAALAGFLSPIGGYKGAGLSVVVDLLTGLLSGASYLTHVGSWVDDPGRGQDLGHAFILIDTARLGPPEWLAERMTDFAAILHDTPRADPDTPVLLPGERELARLREAARTGIALDATLLERLRGLAGR